MNCLAHLGVVYLLLLLVPPPIFVQQLGPGQTAPLFTFKHRLTTTPRSNGETPLIIHKGVSVAGACWTASDA